MCHGKEDRVRALEVVGDCLSSKCVGGVVDSGGFANCVAEPGAFSNRGCLIF